MNPAPDARETRLRQLYGQAGQEHLFQHVHRLAECERKRFLDQLERVDLTLLRRLIGEMKRDRSVLTLDLPRLAPPRSVPLPTTPGGRRKDNRARSAGEELLRQGKVAALMVAGGQGTRLGFDGPKGCFPVGPVSDCSLFQWHFNKVLATRRRYGTAVLLLILTSAANHEATRDFLARHDHFGLPEEDVVLFPQGMLPAVDPSGRLLLRAPDSLFLCPDGHGGALSALAREGILDEMERRGIEQIFYFQVDNPLVKVLDPTFLGHHLLARSDMSSKMVQRRNPQEKVGVFARCGRKLGVVEYSDLPGELAAARDDEGNLLFGAGNIAIHVFALAFLRRLTDGELRLPYHRARKIVPYMDDTGARIEPQDANGVKFETFVFDALPEARRPLVVEASRAEEFSPVKNRSGEDSVDSARRDLIRLFGNWLKAAGLAAPGPNATLEISPLFSLDREEFVRRIRKEHVLCRQRMLLS